MDPLLNVASTSTSTTGTPQNQQASSFSSPSTSTARGPPARNDPGLWKTVSNKRKASPLKKQHTEKQTKLTKYWLGPKPSTENQFEVLSDNETETKIIIEPKPPPIFVNEVENIAPLQALLKTIAPDAYDMKILSSTNVKIMAKSKESYIAIVNALSEKSTMFHTYQLKENRAFRVVLKNVHHTCNLDELKEELTKLGHSVRNIHNIVQRITKKPLSMFFVDLEPRHNNKDIYSIDLLMHLKVKFEPPRIKREIVQCTKCQRYGHTKHFCYNIARCVKCVGNHTTESCNRSKIDSNVQCVLCNGNHPANYKGCEIYKDLQAKQFPKPRPRPLANLGNQTSQIANQSVQPNITYAQAVHNQATAESHEVRTTTLPQSNNITKTQANIPNNDIAELKVMMKALIEQMGTIMNLLTLIVTNITK